MYDSSKLKLTVIWHVTVSSFFGCDDRRYYSRQHATGADADPTVPGVSGERRSVRTPTNRVCAHTYSCETRFSGHVLYSRKCMCFFQFRKCPLWCPIFEIKCGCCLSAEEFISIYQITSLWMNTLTKEGIRCSNPAFLGEELLLFNL